MTSTSTVIARIGKTAESRTFEPMSQDDDERRSSTSSAMPTSDVDEAPERPQEEADRLDVEGDRLAGEDLVLVDVDDDRGGRLGHGYSKHKWTSTHSRPPGGRSGRAWTS